MKKYWALLTILLLANSCLAVAAKGKARFTLGGQKIKKGKGKKKSVTFNAEFCEYVSGPTGFVVCASGKTGEDTLSREDLYNIKNTSVLLSEKLKGAQTQEVKLQLVGNKNRKAGAKKKIKVNPKFCRSTQGSPNIIVCSIGKPEEAAITSGSLTGVQTAAVKVHKKFNQKNKDNIFKYVIDGMHVNSCLAIYGAGDPRCEEDYEGTSECEEDPFAEGCDDFCMINPADPSCNEDNEPNCSDPSGPLYDVVLCEPGNDCAEDPYAPGCDDYCMINPSDPACF